MVVKNKAILIGNSNGIGLATTQELLKRGWEVIGISRSKSPINHPSYTHTVTDVQDEEYLLRLKSILENNESIDLAIFCVGIGELLDFSKMEKEIEVVEVNFLSMIKTVTLIIPYMLKKGKGHFIGLSSLADELLSPEAPSYNASKAGFSNYLEGLAITLKSKGVHITNVRFGFVDTKMAKGDAKPFMMGVDKAVKHLLSCIEKRPIRYTAPWIMIPFVKVYSWILRVRA